MDVNLTIHQMIEFHSDKEPHHIAMIDEDFLYSYRDLNQKANQLAHFLQKFSLKRDAIVAIAIDRSPQLIISLLAILKAGCCYLPLDARQPESRLQYILQDADAPVLITHSTSEDKFSGYSGQVVLIDQVWNEIEMQPLHNPACSVSSDNLAYVIYTSGSTGRPKGVLIEHGSLVNYTRWFSVYSKCHEQDRIDCSSSIIFDMAVTSTITALALGLQVVICIDDVKKNVPQYLMHLKKNKINISKITPSYFKILFQEAMNHAVELVDLQSIILGGEILYTRDCRAWLEMYPNQLLFNEYGPTEATVAVAAFTITHENVFNLGTIVPIGKPGFNIKMELLNENMQTVPMGETGELYVGGIGLARGYLKQNELTARQFIKNSFDPESRTRLYKTGDLCRYLPDGNIEYINRIDDQVKIRGYRIEPGEIETCILSHPMIKESCVIARMHPSGEKQLIAYYLLKNENGILSSQELRQFLHLKLVEYMIPAFFFKVNSFSLTENGKLDKNSLPDFLIDEGVALPRTQLERQLIDIWQKEFHTINIGTNSHFFELGGHSLIATRIIIDIEKTFGKKIRLDDIYKAPTVSELALIISNAENSERKTIPEVISTNTSKMTPLGDFQFIFWVSKLFEPKLKQLNIIARRRIVGKLDLIALTFALEWTLYKHQILCSQISKYFPVSYQGKYNKIQINEVNLNAYPDKEVESQLSVSLDKLINKTLWRKNEPLIELKLFHLKDELSELQISASHMSFDDASENILFSELSKAYLHYKNGSRQFSFNDHPQYADYVFYERGYLNHNLERDIKFWKQYLHDTSLITLPESEVIQNMGDIPYSTYLDLPVELVENAHKICTTASVSITDFLCASVALSLKNVAGNLNNNIYMNIIRSVRDNDIHDKLIGCFLRLDPIKVDLKTKFDMVELAKTIQQSRIETEPYQSCSGMIKLACLEKTYRKKFIRNLIIRFSTSIYCALFNKLQLNSKILSMYHRLNSLRTKRKFLVNVSLFQQFISPSQDKTLFGFELEKTNTHEYDISKFDNVIDIYFLRNQVQEKMYLVVSANLRPAFREQVGNEIIKMIGDI